MPGRDPSGFTAEEAQAVEARAQELYAAARAVDIEAAAQARAKQLYRTLIGREIAAPTPTEVANAVPVQG